jgi:hypothetical protein
VSKLNQSEQIRRLCSVGIFSPASDTHVKHYSAFVSSLEKYLDFAWVEACYRVQPYSPFEPVCFDKGQPIENIYTYTQS